MTECLFCISIMDDYRRSKALSFVDDFGRNKAPSFVDGRRRKLTFTTWCLLGHASKLTFLSAFSGTLDRGHYDVLQIVGGGGSLICRITTKRRKASVNERCEREEKRARKSFLKDSGYPDKNNDDELPDHASKQRSNFTHNPTTQQIWHPTLLAARGRPSRTLDASINLK